MQLYEYYIVFPEGDVQEVQNRLPFNTLVDVNGNILALPLPTNKMIAFKVAGIKTEEKRGETITYHLLDLLSAEELLEYTRL